MKTILIADDETHLRMLVGVALEESDYRLIEASDGTSALEVARRE